MEKDKKLLEDVKKLMMIRYPRFGAQIASANLEYRTDLKYHTAATDGKNIYFDPDYLASLNDDEKLFIIAHELMHVKFEHMYRIMDKDGQRRNPEIWNIATDAIINANLERDGFKIKKGYVNMPEALNYSAEDFYEKLLKERKEQQNQQEQSVNGKNQAMQGQELSDGEEQQFADDHSIWDKAFKEAKEQKNGQDKKIIEKDVESQTSKSCQNGQQKEMKIAEFDESHFNEKTEFEINRKERRENARKNMEELREKEMKKLECGNELGNIGEEKAILDWKLLLRREVEKTETIWSQRRSIAENNYAFRIEENDVEDEAETEVMIDSSASVSDELIKSFLRQLKLILKGSKLKVGFFADYATNEFKEIKANRDIDYLKVCRCGYGTNMDSAVRAFSKRREVNKIVFTDGYPGQEPENDLKDVNVIWIVYENKNFNPCCGKVIKVNQKDFCNLKIAKQDLVELNM